MKYMDFALFLLLMFNHFSNWRDLEKDPGAYLMSKEKQRNRFPMAEYIFVLQTFCKIFYSASQCKSSILKPCKFKCERPVAVSSNMIMTRTELLF